MSIVKYKFLILSKIVITPNGFLAGKTVGIRVLFFYVTQLLVRGKITRTPAGHVCLSFAEIQALLKRVVLKTGITGFKAK